MSEINYPYRGQCLCGAVKYEARKFQPHMANCHCTMCRKFHGAAFATYGEVAREDFRWVEGESMLQTYVADNGTQRRFCRDCGSSMAFASSNADGSVIEIALGTLDTPIEELPDAHVFIANKANWHTISDGLPKFPTGRDSNPKE